MPNWVFCNLSASGTKEQVEQFDADMKQPHPEFVYPEGEKYTHTDAKWQMSKGDEFSFWNALAPTDLEEYFTGSKWYDWNCANWGVKWDVNVEEDEAIYVGEDGAAYKHYHFDTAWSAPTGVFQALCAKYPELELGLSYEEEQGWGGELSSDGEGGAVQTEEYDIPDSHAEYAKRDREDSCVCAWDEDEDDWYADCPRDDADESKTILVENLTSLIPN